MSILLTLKNDTLIFGNYEGNRTFYDMGYSQGYSVDRASATVWGGFLTFSEAWILSKQ